LKIKKDFIITSIHSWFNKFRKEGEVLRKESWRGKKERKKTAKFS